MVVSIQMDTISQIGSFPQIVVNKNISFKPPSTLQKPMEKWRFASLQHIHGLVVITPKNERNVGSHGKDTNPNSTVDPDFASKVGGHDTDGLGHYVAPRIVIHLWEWDMLNVRSGPRKVMLKYYTQGKWVVCQAISPSRERVHNSTIYVLFSRWMVLRFLFGSVNCTIVFVQFCDWY